MSTFFAVLGWTAFAIVFCGLIWWGIAQWITDFADAWKLRTKILNTGAALLGIVVLITVLVSSIDISDDNASHCGAGTRYVSESHLVGKVIITDWACVA